MTAANLSRTVMRFAPSRQRLSEAGRRIARYDAAADSPAAATMQWAFALLAGLLVWVLAFATFFSGLVEHHAQHDRYASFRKNLADGVVPVSAPIRAGTPVALIDAPAGGLHDLVVVEGSTAEQLRGGPGHFPGSPLPGAPGGSLVLGRSVSYGGPFGHLGDFRPGDTMDVTTGTGTYRYIVEDVRRAGDPLPAALPSGGSLLTLESSEGAGWRSGWAPSHAVWVDAVLHGKSTPGGRVGAAGSADKPMASDASNLYEIVLWLQVLLLAVVAITVLRRRWNVWQLWLVAVPVVLAGLWGMTNAMWPLLPNLL